MQSKAYNHFLVVW